MTFKSHIKPHHKKARMNWALKYTQAGRDTWIIVALVNENMRDLDSLAG